MQTIANPPLGTPRYVASGLADLASFFDGRAENERTLAQHSETQRDNRLHSGSAMAYADAASVLRKTSIAPAALDGAQQLDADRKELRRLVRSVPRPFVLDVLSEELSTADLGELQGRLP